MGHSYTKLLVHVVFSTKNRLPLITPELQPRLFGYMGGILRKESCDLIAAGGMADHVHLLIHLHPSIALADLMRITKSRSTHWMHENFTGTRELYWQEGYGGFAVSKSASASVVRYIDRQPQHHRRRTFQEEFIEMLEKHEVDYDPETIWD